MYMPQAEVANTMDNDTFEIHHTDAPVDSDLTTFHYRECYEVHCTLSGNGLFFLDGEEHESAPGTVVLVHYGHMCRLIRQTSPVFERAYCFVSPRFLAKHSTELSNLESCFQDSGSAVTRVVRMDPSVLRGLIDGIEAAQREARQTGDGSSADSESQRPASPFGADILVDQRFVELMIAINRATQSQSDILLQTSAAVSELTTNVMNLISANIQRDLSLDALAEQFHTDKFHLSRQFKRDTSLTVHDFIVKKRLWNAKRLLLRGFNAQSIYQQCGFNSYTHFLRSFKQTYGMTPREFVRRSGEASKKENH